MPPPPPDLLASHRSKHESKTHKICHAILQPKVCLEEDCGKCNQFCDTTGKLAFPITISSMTLSNCHCFSLWKSRSTATTCSLFDHFVMPRGPPRGFGLFAFLSLCIFALEGLMLAGNSTGHPCFWWVCRARMWTPPSTNPIQRLTKPSLAVEIIHRCLRSGKGALENLDGPNLSFAQHGRLFSYWAVSRSPLKVKMSSQPNQRNTSAKHDNWVNPPTGLMGIWRGS